MSVRVLLTSDLHVDVGDFGAMAARLLPGFAAEMDPDVLVIAGDVSPVVSKLKAALQRFSDALSCPKLFVPGNHDIWVARSNRTTDSWMKYDELLPRACAEAGFHYLPGRPMEFAGVGFAGSIGWYDYSLRNRELDGEIKLQDYRRKGFRGRVWNDKYYARWQKDDEEVSEEIARRLDADLSHFDSSSLPVVCVTHHLPFAQLVTHTGDPAWDYFSAFMGSVSLGEAILQHENTKYVFFGHSHRAKEKRIDVLAISAPIGYEHEVHGTKEDHLRKALRVVEVE